MKKKQFLFLPATIVFAITLIISLSFTCQSGAQQTDAEENDSFTLEEVTVTAQKREESLKDVPIAVSVMSGEKMDDFSIVSFQDVSEHLPNVNIVTGPSDYLNIRGVGSSTNLGFEQSVGTFVDGIYHSRARSSQISLFDISRVEVLKGPQTTFFGANSIAGALSVITRRPGDTFDYNITALYGTNDEYNLEAGIDVPLTDKLNLRIAGRINGMDGYLDTPQGEAPNRDNKQARVYLAWKPYDNYQSDLRIDYGTSESQGALAFQLVGCPAPDGTFGVACLNFYANNNGEIDDKLDYHSDTALDYINIDFTEFVWTNTFETGENSSLVLKTSYYSHDAKELFTGVPFPAYNTGASGLPAFMGQLAGASDAIPIRMNEDYKQASQEIRFQTDTGGFFDYMVGAYYSKVDFDYYNDVGFFFMDFGFLTAISIPTDLIPHNILPGEYFAGLVNIYAEDETRSAFSVLNFRPTDRLTINVGGRYTSIKKTANKTQSRGRVDADLSNFQQLSPADEAALNLILGGDQSNFSPNSRTDDDFMPSISLQYDMTDSVMGYVSYAEGFKAGGFSYANFPDIFSPEYVDAYEIGMKGFFLDHKLFAGINFFYNDYTDLQETSVVTQGVTIQNVVRNAASSVSEGIELDAVWMTSQNLMFKANLALLSSEYESFPDAACTMKQAIDAGGSSEACVQDLSGHDRAYSPAWSGNIAAEYDLYFGSYKIAIEPSVYFTDGFYLTTELDPWLYQDAYAKLDLRVGLSPSNGKWELALIGKNLNDKTTSSFASQVTSSDGSARYIVDRPLSVAMQFTVRY